MSRKEQVVHSGWSGKLKGWVNRAETRTGARSQTRNSLRSYALKPTAKDA